jgi:hypothetical protein
MTERRKKGQRRWGLDVAFPLKDSSGCTVIANRRRLPDRRLDRITYEDRLIGFAEMPPIDPERLKGR